MGFVHEIKRALGFDEVSWYSVMRADGPDFTLEDKDIAREISRMYWNAIYQQEKTWIPMQYLSENMTSNKSGSSNVKNVKARIDELKEIADQKANYSNNTNVDAFEASGSYGDVE